LIYRDLLKNTSHQLAWPIYRQNRPITGRIWPIRSAARLAVASADLSAKAADYRWSPADFFTVAADSVRRLSHLCAGRFIGKIGRLLTDFCPVAAESPSPRPPSALLSTRPNGERRIDCSVELGRPNAIYMSSGPSGPIFIFLIQFEFYPTKRSIFGIFSPPMSLEFHLVFYIIFSDFFFIFSEIFEFEFQISAILKIGPGRFRRISAIFEKIGGFF
jgi:hypothetical protein